MSGIDTSMYNSLLQKPKSVADYDAEAMTNRTNALALQQGQMKVDEFQRTVSDGNRLRQVVSNFGSDTAANTNMLLKAGRLTEAQAYQKANADALAKTADVDKTKADTLKTQQETATHQFELAGQLASAWATNPGVTKAQIQAGLAAAAHSGVISPEITQAKMTELDSMADNPQVLNGWAKGTLQQVMKAKDSMSYLAPDANAALQAKTSTDNNRATNATSTANARYSADSSAATARARLAFDKDQVKSGDDAAMDPLAIRMTAQQYLAGDSGALSNFGRGAQGAANLNAVRLEVAKQATAAGLNGADIAAKMAEFGGIKAGQRTAGTRSANIEIAANEAAELAPLAIDASRKVARSGFLPFGKAQIMFDQNTNDPALRQFAMANTALSNAYSQVMSRGGVASVADKEHARELLSVAHDQASYEAAVAQMQQEIKAAQRAPGKVKAAISGGVSGKGEPGAGGAGSKVIDFGSLQ